MKTLLAIYTNRDWLKDTGYRFNAPDNLSITPIYFKKDLELLTRFIAAESRVKLHLKSRHTNLTDNEEYNRKRRYLRAVKQLYKLRAQCHRRKIFAKNRAWGNGIGEFRLIKIG